MKALFNADCEGCQQHRAGCARVFLRLKIGRASKLRRTPTVLCGPCRRVAQGKYVLDERHR